MPLSRVALIDNNSISYALNIDNGIPILPFYNDSEDEELRHLTYYLNCMVEQAESSGQELDVREHNREAFGLAGLRELEVGERGCEEEEG